jgi:hypothetical protein
MNMKNEVVAAFQSSLVPDAQAVKLASTAISEMSKHEGTLGPTQDSA